MTSRARFVLSLSAVAMLALSACTGGTTNTGGTASSDSPADAALPDVAIPTQEEADAQAAQAITAENADAEFEALQREIENETEP